jgi:hypothetical protein
MAKGYKTGGRSLGTENKITKDIREHFSNLIEMNLETFQKDIETLKPIDRVKVLIELSKFVIPTLKAIDMHGIDKDFKPFIINLNHGTND